MGPIEAMFCNEVTKVNRHLIRNSPVDDFFADGDYVISYVYEGDGRYQKYWLMYDPENTARFICSSHKDKLLCNRDDLPVLNTQGKFIDLMVGSRDERLFDSLLVFQNNLDSDTIFHSM